jgi:hypothetical protein
MRTDAEILMRLRDGLTGLLTSGEPVAVQKEAARRLKQETFDALTRNGVSAQDAEDLMAIVAVGVRDELMKEIAK